MEDNFLAVEPDEQVESSGNDSFGPKKVDKLGRVRPSSYSFKKNPPKKTRSTFHQSVEHEECIQDAQLLQNLNELEESQDGSSFMTESEDISETHNVHNENTIHLETVESNLTSNEHIRRLIEEAIFQSQDSNLAGDGNLYSDEKWHELPDQLYPDEDENTERDETELKDDDSKNFEFDKNDTIYHGHHMTIYTSMVLILLYSMCHSISSSQLNDTLTLISLHCLYPHPGLKSLYMFKKFFTDLHSPMKKHFYCSNCFWGIDSDANICPNEKCQQHLSERKKGYFIEIPVENQLRKILQKGGTTEALKQRFTRKKKNSSAIEDIQDGKFYQEFSKSGGPLSADFPYNISLTWNTDGIPIFKSSKVSIWPLYLTINELPMKQRMQTENMILYGLWFGESKPFMGRFTKPLLNTLKKLESDGINLEIDGQTYNSKAFLICGTADLPAKSLVMNCNQFNGQYSCLRCLHPAQTYRTAKGGTVRVFPFDMSKPEPKKRTVQECIDNAIEAVNTRSVVNGIKGPSFLMTLAKYDYVRSSSIDYMHGVLLGITKLLINLWTSGSNSKEKFSISSSISVIDERLKKIKPPSYVTRIPRTISNHIKYWKASELRNWLFFYSLPILCDILPERYFIHYAAFVEGIYLLCTDCIMPEHLKRSKTLLSYFVHMFSSMYGERYLTLNLHSLLHLPECVEDLGPLWAYSCFPYENANGLLTELFHGTQNVELQIISSLNIVQNMSNLLGPISDPVHKAFAEKMHRTCTTDWRNSKKLFGTLSGASPIGSNVKLYVTNDVYSKLISTVGFVPGKCLCYKRISLRGITIHSSEYLRVSVRNTYTVKFYDTESNQFGYGSIKYYILAKKCKCLESFCSCDSSLVAVLYRYEKTKPSILNSNFLDVNASHINVTKLTNSVTVVDSSKIMSVMVNVKYDESSELSFLCEVPNLKECD